MFDCSFLYFLSGLRRDSPVHACIFSKNTQNYIEKQVCNEKPLLKYLFANLIDLKECLYIFLASFLDNK